MPKLIEEKFPFSQLSLIAERESWRKEIYRPVYYLHKWWARRLGSVFRGILLGACLDESDDFWKHFYSSNDFKGTTIFDPFMGSGVTVGEAVKVGCRAIGRDINPVAYLSCQASMSRYSQDEVLSTYQKLKGEVAPTLLSYFATRTREGAEATVLYYFLVKIVACPKCNREVDLFKTRMFSRNAVPRKDPSARCICPDCGAVSLTTYDAETVRCGECRLTYDPRRGNIKGTSVTCNHCQHVFRLVERMTESECPLDYRRYAKLLLTGENKKMYEPLNDSDRELEDQVAAQYGEIVGSFPPVAIAPGYNTNQILKHNYKYWHQLVSDRQLVCIRHMIDAIRGIDNDELRLLFACLFSGVLEFNNLFTSFKGEGTGAVRHMFAHHILKPEMMPIEANIWGTSKSSGAFSRLFRSRVERAIDYKADPFELRLNGAKSTKVRGINRQMDLPIASTFAQFQSNSKAVYLSVGDSSNTDLADDSIDLVVTDPPFFDNVHYSQLADFFYYWLNQTLEISSDNTTRSPKEVQDTDSDLFTAKLTSVFAESSRVLRPGGLLIFTYHHARHEGWTAMHRAIRHAGFLCFQSYPIKAEMSVSMPLRQAKSPIHLDLIVVCRRESQCQTQNSGELIFGDIVSAAKQQVDSLKRIGIRVSLGDAKVILMGRMLCEVHKMGNPEREEELLDSIERDIDTFASQVILTEGEILYERVASGPEQLTLFEKLENYLTKNR
ncbi:MAG: hypothetical protein OXG26_07595 [Caldilineaceae bacterium]|nr:hypothetical protein [Caldilineaceae bacterium]MDE0632036.1 hypothetical protein [Caldilineaceae bacterium]